MINDYLEIGNLGDVISFERVGWQILDTEELENSSEAQEKLFFKNNVKKTNNFKKFTKNQEN